MARLRVDSIAIVRAALRAVHPGDLVARALRLEPLAASRIDLLAVGKAAAAMARSAHAALGDRIEQSLVILPDGSPSGDVPSALHVIVADHPVPTVRSGQAADRARMLASSTPADAALLVLVSGGASALMAAPAPGLTLDDKRQTTDRLLRAGANIEQLNAVRKHLSALKGGQLALQASAAVRTLAISDVVGDDPSLIGSGPTVADPTTFADAQRVIDLFGGPALFPPAVIEHLRRGARGEIADTPKPGDARLARCLWRLAGSRRDAMAGAAAEARARGYDVQIVDEPLVGEARVVGPQYCERLLRERPRDRLRCVISSGETTVHVRGSGRGGRNQELAASLALGVSAIDGTVVVASCGTDGVDGPTDAAGALVDTTTAARAAERGLSLTACLDDNDTYRLFQALGDLIVTGPTGTNVGDLQVSLLGPSGI